MENDADKSCDEVHKFYEQKQRQKMEESVNAILTMPEATAIRNERELDQLKYRLLNQKVGVLGGNSWHLVRAVKDGFDEPISCKVTDLSKVSEKLKKSLQTEGFKIINFLIQNQHKNLIKLVGLFVNEQKILYTFQELIADSLEAEVILHGKGLAEHRTREVVKDIGNALFYLHTCGIAHRDVNIQNIVIHKEKKVCKLTNFEYCVVCWDPQTKKVKLHTCTQDKSLALFLAPEEFEDQPYNAQCSDIWSLAALVVYLLTTEYPPRTNFEIFKANKLPGVSAECTDFLKRCFTKNSERPDILHCITDKWFRVYTQLH